MAVLLTPPYLQFFDDNGAPLSGGKVHTYASGTTTQKETYTNAEGLTAASNPVVLDAAGRCTLWGVGTYKLRIYDSSDNFIRETDDVTSFNATTETTEGFYQSFSGDSYNKVFTLTENLGADEKALTVYAELECVTNGSFSEDSGWTKGTGWSIGSGLATATGAISTALEQSSAVTLVEGKLYSVEYTITRSAGSITLSLGGVAGTSRSSSGTYTETIIAGSTQAISFGTSGFTGTVDNVSIREVGGAKYIPPTFYTLDGENLEFTIPPAKGTNNISVTAPYTLIGAAGVAQVAADDALDAKAAAEQAAIDAASEAATVAGLSTTSSTSLTIGTGEKVFTVESGKGFSSGMFVLCVSSSNPSNYMHGQVSSYAGTSLVLDVSSVGGAGEYDDWVIDLSGVKGEKGSAGTVSGASAATIALNDKILALDASDGDALIHGTAEDLLALSAGVTSVAGKTGVVSLNKSDVGLSNVQNVDQTNASNLSSGTVPTARLGSGTANSTTVLHGDGTWSTSGGVVAAGAVGAYAIQMVKAGKSVAGGTTIAGSQLTPIVIGTDGLASTTSGTSFGGTWRNMQGAAALGDDTNKNIGLFQRIS